MKVIDYIKQKGILITNEQRIRIQTIWHCIYSFCGLIMISLMTIRALEILNVIALNRVASICINFGIIVVMIPGFALSSFYQNNFFQKIILYRLCKKHPQKFEIEMRDTTAEKFEGELKSIYKAWVRKPFKWFINDIKLSEWDWKPPEIPQMQDCGDTVTINNDES